MRARLLTTVLAAAVAAACSSSPDASGREPATPTGSPDETGTPPAAPTAGGPAGLTWSDARRHDLGDGLAAGPCPGGGSAPLRCVTRRGEDLVAIELIRFPTRTIEVLQGASGADVVPGLRTIAQDAYDSFEADRRAGCGPDATFDPVQSTEQLVAGRPGLHWWFALRRGGAVDELVDTYATVVGHRLVIIRYAGYGPDSCLPPEGTAYDPAVLTELRPALAAAVAGAEI